MANTISIDDMANMRHSLAQAGIYFDKLYINQAYFNSNFTINALNNKKKKLSRAFWQKFICGSTLKQSSIATQTNLTVRDDCEKIPPLVTSCHRLPTIENQYDQRRCRPLNKEYIHKKYQQPVRRRRSSHINRSVQRQKQMNNDDDIADDDRNYEFAV